MVLVYGVAVRAARGSFVRRSFISRDLVSVSESKRHECGPHPSSVEQH